MVFMLLTGIRENNLISVLRTFWQLSEDVSSSDIVLKRELVQIDPNGWAKCGKYLVLVWF